MYHNDGKTSQSGAHYVLATGIFTGKDGKEYISLLNTMANTGKDGYITSSDSNLKPYCQSQTMPVSQLKRTLCSVVLIW
jgi:hypothetical protein